jgi:murein DD-endopeptidase MepM/ murein hydrolase activator NlpD
MSAYVDFPETRHPDERELTKLRGALRFCAAIACALLVLTLWGAPLPARAALGDYPFRVETVEQDNGFQIVARNDGPAPITVRIVLTEVENLVGDQTWPMVAVVAPRQSSVLRRLFRARSEGTARLAFSYRHQFGDVAAVHERGVVYRLPFEAGRTFLVSQAHGGSMTTHTTPGSVHAVDIAMPEGTPVLAARDGVVIDVDASHVRGGREPDLLDKANSVIIVHQDGTMARYVHLNAGKHAWVGQGVRAGTLIGYSGNTGYSSGPHLHFVVQRASIGADGTPGQTSLPIEFYAYQPPLRFAPQQGMMVTSNYNAPGAVPPVLPLGSETVRGR